MRSLAVIVALVAISAFALPSSAAKLKTKDWSCTRTEECYSDFYCNYEIAPKKGVAKVVAPPAPAVSLNPINNPPPGTVVAPPPVDPTVAAAHPGSCQPKFPKGSLCCGHDVCQNGYCSVANSVDATSAGMPARNNNHACLAGGFATKLGGKCVEYKYIGDNCANKYECGLQFVANHNTARCGDVVFGVKSAVPSCQPTFAAGKECNDDSQCRHNCCDCHPSDAGDKDFDALVRRCQDVDGDLADEGNPGPWLLLIGIAAGSCAFCCLIGILYKFCYRGKMSKQFHEDAYHMTTFTDFGPQNGVTNYYKNPVTMSMTA